MTEQYAQAIWNLAYKDGVVVKGLVANLVKHLQAEDKMKLLPGIVLALKRLEQRNAKLAPKVEVATQAESAHALKEAAAHGIHAAHAEVNHSLIKGWRATGNGKLIDRTAKRSLLDLYRNVVA